MAQTLINLDPKDYEHPFDKGALEKVKKIPVLPDATNFMVNWTAVKWRETALCGNGFRVTLDSCPDLSMLATQVFNTLQLNYKPQLYMEQDYYINAYTVGHEENAFVSLSSGAVDKLSDAELAYVIGHEAGHIKSGHMLYHMMIAYMTMLLSKVPMANLLRVPLMYWNRMSEFTADRAGLLANQNLEASLSAIMKMSGLPERYYSSASLDGFIAQSRDFEETYSRGTNGALRLIEIIDEDHPWTVIRASELIKWYNSGDYARILQKTAGKTCPQCKKSIDPSLAKCPYCGHIF